MSLGTNRTQLESAARVFIDWISGAACLGATVRRARIRLPDVSPLHLRIEEAGRGPKPGALVHPRLVDPAQCGGRPQIRLALGLCRTGVAFSTPDKWFHCPLSTFQLQVPGGQGAYASKFALCGMFSGIGGRIGLTFKW